uniref:Uncharacterized protein n=1 Tax=Anguilla anguilla TaxID=7936 RepID=A0A0E9RGZ1_ANGAN
MRLLSFTFNWDEIRCGLFHKILGSLPVLIRALLDDFSFTCNI